MIVNENSIIFTVGSGYKETPLLPKWGWVRYVLFSITQNRNCGKCAINVASCQYCLYILRLMPFLCVLRGFHISLYEWTFIAANSPIKWQYRVEWGYCDNLRQFSATHMLEIYKNVYLAQTVRLTISSQERSARCDDNTIVAQ